MSGLGTPKDYLAGVTELWTAMINGPWMKAKLGDSTPEYTWRSVLASRLVITDAWRTRHHPAGH
jgi:hypothetical protein